MSAATETERMPAAVYALSVGAFAIGTTEFVVMGLLLEMAGDLQVSITTAGYVVTAYALGVVVGAPLLTPLLGRFPRRPALTGLMALFTIGNLACALAGSLPVILVARVVTAFAHASYFGIGSVVASEIAPPSRRSSAISTMFLGATIANIVGVPGGTLIGQAFGWRASFVAVALVGAVATSSTYAFLPRMHNSTGSPNLAAEWATVRRPDVLRAFATTALGFSGTFAVFTYIAPMLTSVSGLPERYVSPILLLFGFGMMVGNPIGGRLADKDTKVALRLTLGALATVLLAFPLGMRFPSTACLMVFVLGAAMFATIPPLQTNVIAIGHAAPTLAASCNIAAFNLGNALGAWVGGEVIASGFGLKTVPLAGAALTSVGLGLVLIGSRASGGSLMNRLAEEK